LFEVIYAVADIPTTNETERSPSHAMTTCSNLPELPSCSVAAPRWPELQWTGCLRQITIKNMKSI
jgi:hypothetical protein